MLDYSPLFKRMEETHTSQYQLLKDGVLTNKQLDALKKGKANFTSLTLEKLCKKLDCSLDDILQFK